MYFIAQDIKNMDSPDPGYWPNPNMEAFRRPQDGLVSGITTQHEKQGSRHQATTPQGGQAEGPNNSEVSISGGENSEVDMNTGERDRDPRRGRQRERTYSTARSADSVSASESSRKRGRDRETF